MVSAIDVKRPSRLESGDLLRMPAQGWKVVSVREEVFAKVEKRAVKEHRTVTNMVEAILREATEK